MDVEALFDDEDDEYGDDATILPAEARAACAAAFSEVFDEAEVEVERDMEVSLRDVPEQPAAGLPR
jgi:hypothetical protein